MASKYKVGDKVRIKSLYWYNENKNKYGIIIFNTMNGDYSFTKDDACFCGRVVTIIYEEKGHYLIAEDDRGYFWVDDMIEGLVEEETKPEPKFKVGDKVRIKSLDWYNENKSKSHGTVVCGGKYFEFGMKEWCGEIMTILEADEECYIMKEDGGRYLWIDEMIEGLVEEETKPKYEDEVNGEYYSTPKYLVRPSGYQFVDENGNIINATKIVLEKKKKEYPKTYEECCKVLNIAVWDLEVLAHMLDTTETVYRKNLDRLLNSLRKLLICRDAYWKIAGEEMGLGKPWEPDYDSGVDKFGIICLNGIIQESDPTAYWVRHLNKVLDFPTKEMRDAFYENFKKDIEICKELL